MRDRLNGWLASAPKVELHIHLEGGMRLETVRELASKYDPGSAIGSPEWVAKAFDFRSFAGFLEALTPITKFCIRSPRDYERIADELFEDLASQNVKYAEVSFSPTPRLEYMTFAEMAEAIDLARERAERKGLIKIGLIAGLNRSYGPERAMELVKAAIENRHRGIVGLDLHGDEINWPPELFKESFQLAREEGLGTIAHAGEAVGADSIWGAVKVLGVSRVEHGIQAIGDGSLMEYLRQHKITLDICPTSNIKTGVVASWDEHPIRRLFDAGVKVTVNSDDPLPFQTTITQELKIAVDEFGFTKDEIRQVTLNAVDGSFLPSSEKASIKKEIEQSYDSI